MFRRRRRDEALPPDEQLTAEESEQDEPEQPAEAEPVVPAGPWDAAHVPSEDLARLDLGALLVPVYEDMEVRVEVSPESEVVAATLVDAGGGLQVNAFAAPRREGIWTEVRAEIAASVRENGGTSEEATGPFGPELHAKVRSEGQGRGLQPARFVGVDGPRWFVRGVITGRAATDPAHAGRLEEAFRELVVVRGGEAMAPRDPLPLRLPTEAVEAAGTDGNTLDPFERGPEITEIQ